MCYKSNQSNSIQELDQQSVKLVECGQQLITFKDKPDHSG